mmetsp:Transcript_15659/g.28473  ORF Transcript_15659/g.28473 Transcript_15659/m.28473 type:complete len:252 (-) Transcript_15659:95-850(-)|eukprot:CAMPEP_0198288910 /NCGR_PEP_ID=MMETSP1449-20131203/7263_1 /TAXON_ID=420275 /ORGANISM="Attheya septentrionalis, Strain CCMP2084" /LENGTH=251 /DNA_ID=CAMNT_0043987147 /DNA_START=199 /DNA_END=954 /DNA_ORIENTATION=-
MLRLVVLLLLAPMCASFVTVPMTRRMMVPSHGTSRWMAGKGFGKQESPKPTPQKTRDEPASSSGGDALQSIESGTVEQPIMESTTKMISNRPAPLAETSPDMPVEERTGQIMRERFGLKTYEEQEMARKESKSREDQAQRMQRLKQLAEDDTLDLFTLLPAPLLTFIDRFLKGGLAISTVCFILAGCGICAEAWSASSGKPLPPDMDKFIVNVVEPNFTPGLIVLLGFSISLGIFASAQLGSETSTYQEDP